MSVYQHVGSLATTTYVTRQGVGPRGNFESDGTDADTVVEAAWLYVATIGGGEVVIGAGDYGDPSGTINSQGNNVTLRGMGYGTYLHTSGAFHAVELNTHDYVTIKNLRLAQTSSGNNNDALQIESGANYFCIERVWITDSDRGGIYLSGTNIDYGWILNCYITGTDATGIDTDMTGGNYLTYLVVVGNIISSAGNYGLDFSAMRRTVITNNIVISSGWSGMRTASGSYETAIVNNIIYDAQAGHNMQTSYSARLIISGNISYSSPTDGVYLNECDYLIVSNNLIYDPADDGIEFDDSDYCSCIGNTIYSAGDSGILWASGASQNAWTCSGNTIISSNTRGILIQTDTVSHAIVSNNFIHGTTTNHGIELRRALVSGNYIYNIDGSGIVIYGSGMVIGNLIESCSSHGIVVWGADYIYVIGNYSVSNGSWGISIDSDADSNLVTGNFTRGNTSGCCRVNNANCDNNRIWLNNFDEGNITDIGTNTAAFDNFDPSAKGWIATIGPPAGGR